MLPLDMRRPPPMPLHYALWLPTATLPAQPPLVLLLHGSGSNEQDLLPLAPLFSDALGGAVVASLRGPYDQLGGYAWFHGNSARPPRVALDQQIGDSADKVAAFLDAAPAALGTDGARAHLFGFSQGATVGWAVALSPWARADLLARLIVFSGRLMPELLDPATPLGKRLGACSRDALAARPAVLGGHGTADPITPIEIGRENVRLARKAGLELDWYEHAGGHGLDADVMGWISARLGRQSCAAA